MLDARDDQIISTGLCSILTLAIEIIIFGVNREDIDCRFLTKMDGIQYILLSVF